VNDVINCFFRANIKDEEGRTIFATTELTTRFLAPVKQGLVTATATVRGPEGRSFYGEAKIIDESGNEVAFFTSVFRVARDQGFDE